MEERRRGSFGKVKICCVYNSAVIKRVFIFDAFEYFRENFNAR